jgi:hypothetical protein
MLMLKRAVPKKGSQGKKLHWLRCNLSPFNGNGFQGFGQKDPRKTEKEKD